MADLLHSALLTAFSFYSPKSRRLEVKKYRFFQLASFSLCSIYSSKATQMSLLTKVCQEVQRRKRCTQFNCSSHNNKQPESEYDSRSDQIPSTVHIPTIPCCQVLQAIQEKAIKLIMTFAFSFLGEKRNKSHYFILQEQYPEIFFKMWFSNHSNSCILSYHALTTGPIFITHLQLLSSYFGPSQILKTKHLPFLKIILSHFCLF